MSQKLSDYKALLFDVDKTLSNSRRQVTPRTQQALHRLSQAGYSIALCTGRSYASVYRPVMPLFPAQTLHITSGGGQIVDITGAVQWEQLVPAETTRALVEVGQARDQMFFLPIGRYAYATDRMIKEYQNLHPLVPEMKPLAETPAWTPPVIPMADITPEFLDYLRSLDLITVKETISFRGRIGADVTARGVTKAAGVVEWAKRVGVSTTEIIGFGDSDNDVEFLEVVGWSVAMGNATPAIKNITDRVIGDTDQDGLAVYLEQILEGADL